MNSSRPTISASPISSEAVRTRSGSEPYPERLALYGITLNQLVDKLTNANRSFLVGAFEQNNKNTPVVADQNAAGGTGHRASPSHLP